MTQWHMKSKRKSTGGMRATVRAEDKKLHSIGGNPAHTTIAVKDPKRETENKRGSTSKVRLKTEKFVYAVEGKKIKKLEIIAVEENNADRQFARKNVITKGAVVKAKDGSKEVFVKVTSRPGQSGSIMGKVLESFETHQEKKAKKKEEKEAIHKSAKTEKKHESHTEKTETHKAHKAEKAEKK